MGEILSFPAAPGRKIEQSLLLAEKWSLVLDEHQDELLARTIRNINALPTSSLLAAYRFAGQLSHNQKQECRWLQSLMETIGNLDSAEIVELGKVASLLAQGYVINWHGAQMEFAKRQAPD